MLGHHAPISVLLWRRSLLRGGEVVRTHSPTVVLGTLLAKQIFQGYLAAHGLTSLNLLQGCCLDSGGGGSSMKTALAHALNFLAGHLHTVSGMGGAILDHLGVDGAVVGTGVGWGFTVDPDTVDARNPLGLGDGRCAGYPFGRFIRLDNHKVLCYLNILAVSQREVEVVHSATIEHEGSVAVLAELAQRFLADKEASFYTVLFPLAGGWIEDIDDGVVCEGENVGH